MLVDKKIKGALFEYFIVKFKRFNVLIAFILLSKIGIDFYLILVITVLFIVLVIIYFSINAQNNMGNRGISFGFGFLSHTMLMSGYPIKVPC